jgi:hypothetical protein
VRNIPIDRKSQKVWCFGSTDLTINRNRHATLKCRRNFFLFLFTVRHCIPIKCRHGPVLFCGEPRRCYRGTVLYCHLFVSKLCFLFKFHWLSHKPRLEEALPYIGVQELALERSLVQISVRVLFYEMCSLVFLIPSRKILTCYFKIAHASLNYNSSVGSNSVTICYTT